MRVLLYASWNRSTTGVDVGHRTYVEQVKVYPKGTSRYEIGRDAEDLAKRKSDISHGWRELQENEPSTDIERAAVYLFRLIRSGLAFPKQSICQIGVGLFLKNDPLVTLDKIVVAYNKGSIVEFFLKELLDWKCRYAGYPAEVLVLDDPSQQIPSKRWNYLVTEESLKYLGDEHDNIG